MNILLINTSDKLGGAAVACSRLRDALRKEGVAVNMLVAHKETADATVYRTASKWMNKVYFLWERLGVFLHNGFRRDTLFQIDIATIGTDVTQLDVFKQADVVHLHWWNQGTLSLDGLLKIIRTKKPIVWTMHDMWPFTGICHYTDACTAYHQECHNCPLLFSRGGSSDLSHTLFLKKKAIYRQGDIAFVGCSDWLANQARRSALVDRQQVFSIPNPIDISAFYPADKRAIRKELNLPVDKKYILFGAVNSKDPRKGLDYMLIVSGLLATQDTADYHFLLVGKSSEEIKDQLALPATVLPFTTDQKQMSLYYQAASVFVIPSLQENLPNMVMEAMACGTPCVGFEVGGIPEMIQHQSTGYVARLKEAEDLAAGIVYCLADEAKLAQLSIAARRWVEENYAEARVADRYLALYNELLQSVSPQVP